MSRFKQKVFALAESKVGSLGHVTPIDRFLKFFFLGLIPKSVTPNQITVFRFVSIPFLIYLLLTEQYIVATILFLFSAFSDAVDGALARTSHQITSWGILADPLADKLLIGSVGLILISKLLTWKLAAAIIVIELLTLASAYYRYKGKAVPAKVPAKIKMILQCVGIIFLFFYILFSTPILLTLALWTLILAIVFAILSLTIYRSI